MDGVPSGTPSTDHEAAGGWVATTFARSLRTGVLVSNAVWQGVMIIALISSPETVHFRQPLVVAHVAIVVLAFAVRARRAPDWTVVMAVNVVLVADWAVADSIEGALCLAATWMFHLAQFQVGMLLDGRAYRYLAPVGGILVPACIAVVHPEGILSLVPAVVGGAGIRWAGRLAIPLLDGLARDLDDEMARDQQVQRDAVADEAAAAQAAEQARTLHDTVINTMASIASGGESISDADLVRQRCRRDVDVLASMVEGAERDARPRLHDVAAEAGLVVHRTGLSAERTERIVASLPRAGAAALEGGVREAAQNAARHAGVDEIEVRVLASASELVVAVVDHGVGFDPTATPTAPLGYGGRGLPESIRARAADAGLGVEVLSTPGEGTEVRFTCPRGRLGSGSGAAAAAQGRYDVASAARARVEAVHRSAVWAIVAGVVAVGIGIEGLGRPGVLSANYVMLAFVAAIGLAARFGLRGRERLAVPGSLALAATVPVAYLLALRAVDFDREGLVHWHSLGAVPPVVLLLALAGQRWYALGVGLVIVTAGVATAMQLGDGATDVAAIIPVGTAPTVVVLGGWYVFHRTLDRVGQALATEHRAAVVAELERVERRASRDARERWRDVGLRSSLALLGGLADGTHEPRDAKVRERCAVEESFLRQLILLEPDLVQMGYWLGRALAEARAGEVDLVVRTGGVDVPEEDAARLGDLLLGVVARSPAHQRLTVTLFSISGRLRFSLEGPAVAIDPVVAAWAPPTSWSCDVLRPGDRAVVEVISSAAADVAAVI